MPKNKGFSKVCDWSWWRDLNPWPLPYQGSALPTVPHQRIKFFGIIFVLGFSLPRWCSTYWAITASAKYWVVFSQFYTGKDIANIMVTEEDLKIYESVLKDKYSKNKEKDD